MVKKTRYPNLSRYYYNSINLWLQSLYVPLALISPLAQRNKVSRKRPALWFSGDLSTEDFELAFWKSLNKAAQREALEIHQSRFRNYLRLYTLITFLTYVFVGVPLFIFILSILKGIGVFDLSNDTRENLVKFILYPLLLVSGAIAFGISNRLAPSILDRSYADTLSLVSSVYIVLNLMKDHVFLVPIYRKQLLMRVRSLRKYIVILSYQYTDVNSDPKSWATDRFQLMKSFVTENEWHIITPIRNTQAQLIGDMRSLVEIFLSANYGEFEFKSSTLPAEAKAINQPRRILGGILKTLGILVPVLLFIGIYRFPDQFEILGLDKKVVALTSLAWFLLAVDILLNLGIVDRVVGIAKTFKELMSP